jgi:hypothetical protein
VNGSALEGREGAFGFTPNRGKSTQLTESPMIPGRFNGAHLLPLVRAGVQFTDGEQVDAGDRVSVSGPGSSTTGPPP